MNWKRTMFQNIFMLHCLCRASTFWSIHKRKRERESDRKKEKKIDNKRERRLHSTTIHMYEYETETRTRPKISIIYANGYGWARHTERQKISPLFFIPRSKHICNNKLAEWQRNKCKWHADKYTQIINSISCSLWICLGVSFGLAYVYMYICVVHGLTALHEKCQKRYVHVEFPLVFFFCTFFQVTKTVSAKPTENKINTCIKSAWQMDEEMTTDGK